MPGRGEILIGYGNAEEMTSNKAFQLVKRLKLEDGDFALIEDMLRFKRSTLRKQLIDLLMTREDEGLKGFSWPSLGGQKEEKRTAALDMLMQIRKDSGRKELAPCPWPVWSSPSRRPRTRRRF